MLYAHMNKHSGLSWSDFVLKPKAIWPKWSMGTMSQKTVRDEAGSVYINQSLKRALLVARATFIWLQH